VEGDMDIVATAAVVVVPVDNNLDRFS